MRGASSAADHHPLVAGPAGPSADADHCVAGGVERRSTATPTQSWGPHNPGGFFLRCGHGAVTTPVARCLDGEKPDRAVRRAHLG
jgi:hypothetical protein